MSFDINCVVGVGVMCDFECCGSTSFTAINKKCLSILWVTVTFWLPDGLIDIILFGLRGRCPLLRSQCVISSHKTDVLDIRKLFKTLMIFIVRNQSRTNYPYNNIPLVLKLELSNPLSRSFYPHLAQLSTFFAPPNFLY